MKQNKIVLDDNFSCMNLYIRNLNFVFLFEASLARASVMQVGTLAADKTLA